MQSDEFEVLFDGRAITSKDAFFDAWIALSCVPDWTGRNLDALWDTLTGLLESPLVLTWLHAEVSAKAMGSDFDSIVSLMREAEVEPPDGWFKLWLIEGVR